MHFQLDFYGPEAILTVHKREGTFRPFEFEVADHECSVRADLTEKQAEEVWHFLGRLLGKEKSGE